ncbi:VPLPA-CTERM sorting domain-containing protein [Meridianimarinicoccus aquatilis]|nr:VPLPA-CTERM sorting domain-containing protein [Fluviibacterium aquatile]QIE43966.1 VPLPA-CTERM sorting domain-containing protein [Rhodobacteraceae bacterium SC52]
MKYVAIASLGALMMAGSVSAQAIIDNGTVQLGVDELGQLNVSGGTASPVSGTTAVGLRHMPTGYESTSHGCECEGWGVGIGETEVAGYANNAIGTANLTGLSFTSTASTATSTVKLTSGELEVTHSFAPSASTSNLYEVNVAITNTSGVDIADLRYTRTFDWDIEPNAFSEVVTISGTGTTASLLKATNNGFDSSNPFASRSTRSGYVENTDVVDFGPADHGANFDFGFGALAAGETFEFSMFYGAAATEASALDALGEVGAELFSLGQPSSDPLGTGTNGSVDTATFVFGFANVGGTVIIPDPTPQVPLPASVLFLTGGIAALGAMRRMKKAA